MKAITIQQWAKQWLVKFTPSKTKLMTCTLKKKDYPSNNFNGVQLTLWQTINTWACHSHINLAGKLMLMPGVNALLESVGSLSDI